MTGARGMEISVMYPAAGERLRRHTMGELWEYASVGIDGVGAGWQWGRWRGRGRITWPQESYNLTVITIVTCTLPSRSIYYLEPGVRCLLPRGTLETEIYLCSNNWRVHLIPVWIFQPRSISRPIINNGGRWGSQGGWGIIQIASAERDRAPWRCICRGFEWQGVLVFFFFFKQNLFFLPL